MVFKFESWFLPEPLVFFPKYVEHLDTIIINKIWVKRTSKIKQVSWGLMAERFVVIQMSFWLKDQVKPNQMSPSDFLVSPWLLQCNLNGIKTTSEMFSHGFHLTWLIKAHSGRPIVIQILTRWNKTVSMEPGRYLDDICSPLPPPPPDGTFSIFHLHAVLREY